MANPQQIYTARYSEADIVLNRVERILSWPFSYKSTVTIMNIGPLNGRRRIQQEVNGFKNQMQPKKQTQRACR